jgi:multicomponent Na+:H+ antiporter subunit F
MTGLLRSIGLTFAYVVLTVGLLACFVRVARGPSLADRVLAVDLMTVVGAGLMAIAAISFDDSVFLDVALILIVTGFVGTAAFAQIIERKYRREPDAQAPAEAATDEGRRWR